MHVAAEGLVIESVHALVLQVTPPVIHPQLFPEPSDIKLQEANVFSANEEHKIG